MPDNGAYLEINADKTIIKSNGIGVSAYSNGTLKVKGDLAVEAETAVSARGYSKIEINKDKQNTVQLKGDVEFTYAKVCLLYTSNITVLGGSENIGINCDGSTINAAGKTVLTVADSFANNKYLDNDKGDNMALFLYDNANATMGETVLQAFGGKTASNP